MEEALNRRRENLRKSERTTVTLPNGNRFLENADGSLVPLGEKAQLIEAAADPKLAHILERVYLGSQDAAANLEGLREVGVTHILNVATGISPLYPEEFVYKNVSILDIPEVDISSYFPECFDFIEQGSKDGVVLIHCNAGVSRSASMVIGWVMNRQRIGFEEAHSLVRKARDQIRPNPGFIQRLKDYERKLNISSSS